MMDLLRLQPQFSFMCLSHHRSLRPDNKLEFNPVDNIERDEAQADL